MRPSYLVLLITTAVSGAAALVLLCFPGLPDLPGIQVLGRKPEIGEVLDSHRGVAVHYNGRDAWQSHASHRSEEGYYYGKSWQCVEFVKRFYFDAKGHRMPNVWGHARDFFSPGVPHGALNTDRGLVQFHNGGDVAPRVDDLVVFRAGTYGHVAIVSAVGEDYVEMVQQNVGERARDRWDLERRNGGFTIVAANPPAGWLRLPIQASLQAGEIGAQSN